VNYEVTLGKQTHRVQIKDVGGSLYEVAIDGEAPVRVDVAKTPRTVFSLLIGNRQWEGSVDAKPDGSFDVHVGASAFDIHVIDERRKLLTGAAAAPAGGRQELRAQMPGKIVKVLVSPGEAVEVNQGLVIIEAMKMENELRSEVAGVVREVRAREGETVESGALLVVVEPPDGGAPAG
jgi:biotin carboxyl carrier protein